VVHKASDKMKETGISDAVSGIGQKVVSGAKSVASKVSETVTDPNLGSNVKSFGSKVATGVKDTASAIGNKAGEIWQERDQIVSKTAEIAKKGFFGVTGFFKKLTGSGGNDSQSDPPKEESKEDVIQTNQ